MSGPYPTPDPAPQPSSVGAPVSSPATSTAPAGTGTGGVATPKPDANPPIGVSEGTAATTAGTTTTEPGGTGIPASQWQQMTPSEQQNALSQAQSGAGTGLNLSPQALQILNIPAALYDSWKKLPAVDQVPAFIAWSKTQQASASTATKAVDPTVSAAEQAYFSIWGVKSPGYGNPGGYLEGLVKSGMNVYEIIANELAKPRAQHTQYWRDREASYAAEAAQVFARR